MPGTFGPNLALKWGWAPHETGWGVDGYNPGFAKLDALVSLHVTAQQNSPPGSPAEGDRYLVGAVPAGGWSAASADDIATYRDGAWVFYAPNKGLRCFSDELFNFLVFYPGSGWQIFSWVNPDVGTIANGDILVYDSVTGYFVNIPGGVTGGITSLTGPVTASGPGAAATSITADAITNVMLANMAAHTFKGNNTAGSADPLDLTATQLTAELNAVVGDSGSGGTKGLVPAPAAGDAAAGKYLNAAGAYSTPPDTVGTVGGITSLTGPVTASGPGAAATSITADAITNTMLANMAAHTFKGNNTAGSADPLDLTATQLTAELNAVVGDSGSGGTKGLAPAAAAGDAAAGKYLAAGGGYSVPPGLKHYTIGFSAPQTTVYSASQVVGHHKMAVATTLPANFGAYQGRASQAGGTANATGSTVISVEKATAAAPNTWTQIGTITIAAAGVTPTFATAAGAAINFAQGDVMREVLPASPDATFVGFYSTIVMYET